jgi:hypothetical protein
MATYRYGVVRSRIAASQLVMSRSAVRVRSSALFLLAIYRRNRGRGMKSLLSEDSPVPQWYAYLISADLYSRPAAVGKRSATPQPTRGASEVPRGVRHPAYAQRPGKLSKIRRMGDVDGPMRC